MSTAGFNEILHMPHRLRIAVMLAEAENVEFATLRDTLEIADSVTSKHLKVLVDAGYVKLAKPTGLGGKMRTWARLTPAGRAALETHLTSLQAMVDATRTAISTGLGPDQRLSEPAPQ